MKASREDRLLAALITHKTVRDAAKAANIPERTAFDMLARTEFSQRYNEMKTDILRGATGEVRDSMIQAAKTMREIMDDTSSPPAVRLSAAKTILESGVKMFETENIISRITALEAVINTGR